MVSMIKKSLKSALYSSFLLTALISAAGDQHLYCTRLLDVLVHAK